MYALEYGQVKPEQIQEFVASASAADEGIAAPALLFARLDYPRLDASNYLRRLDQMGEAVRARVAGEDAAGDQRRGIEILNRYLFEEEGFRGNRDTYEDPRNSFLNEVLDRRSGIPITLAVIYMEVARRARVQVHGVNFPGHFLLRCQPDAHTVLILDPFRGGARLTEHDCRDLLHRQVGKDVRFHRRLLAPATKKQILLRMLVNLKHAYVHLRSFPQARTVTELLLALDPAAIVELRDRGLLAYHLNDFPAALRDLEAYLHLSRHAETAEDDREELGRIWEHVKALRRRVAGQN
jgi:regulator of sirC expression with transglutaminase-like and TPR domain